MWGEFGSSEPQSHVSGRVEETPRASLLSRWVSQCDEGEPDAPGNVSLLLKKNV